MSLCMRSKSFPYRFKQLYRSGISTKKNSILSPFFPPPPSLFHPQYSFSFCVFLFLFFPILILWCVCVFFFSSFLYLSCCGVCVFRLLGTFSCTTFGGISFSWSRFYICNNDIHIGHPLLFVYLHKSLTLQHHEQQISWSVQGMWITYMYIKL